MVHPHEEGHPAGDIGPSWEGSVRKVAQRTILVADDDASVRSLLRQLLADEGYAVVEATTGTEVVEKVKDVNPDLVIMDVRMPELDGIEALSQLKVSSPRPSASWATRPRCRRSTRRSARSRSPTRRCL